MRIKYENWFGVSKEGLSASQHTRDLVNLTQEGIANSFDSGATEVKVTVRAENDQFRLVIEDNGPGFSDIHTARELHRIDPTRTGDPSLSGRFGRGEKELVSVSTEAKIVSVGKTVEFRQDESCVISDNRRTAGTVLSAVMPWTREQADEVLNGLRRVQPREGITMLVNGSPVERRETVAECAANLPTIIQETPDSPIRKTRRNTNLQIFAPREKEGAWIYELGMPVQPIDGYYSVDVGQKIPLSPNRDTVPDSYLKRIYTAVLNATHNILPTDEFAEVWVRSGMESKDVSKSAVDSVIDKRYGGKLVFSSGDGSANADARDHGYRVLGSREISGAERDNLVRAGIEGSHKRFGAREMTDDMLIMPKGFVEPVEFADWVIAIARLIGLNATVSYINAPDAQMLAQCTVNSLAPVVTFNVGLLSADWFKERGRRQLSLVIHELAHAYGNGSRSHGLHWGNSCAEIGAILVEKGFTLE